MRTLKFLLQKEFRQIFRNPGILRMIIAVPIVQLIILPLAADYEIKNINISVVDHDHSSLSKELVDKVVASGYFRLNDYSSSFEESFAEFQKDKSDIILEIPNDFEKDLVVSKKSNLFVAVNAINGAKALVGSAYLNMIIRDYNKDIVPEWMQESVTSSVPLVEVASTNWYNPLLKYTFFMVPAILVILVTMVGAFLCSLNIVKEKEVGTIEQINVTPIRKYHFILGKLIPFWIIGMIVFSIGLLGIARFVFNIVPEGSLLVLYAFLAIYLLALLGIGLLISTFSNTQQQAMSVAFFFILVFMLMSGLFTPIDGMPEWAQFIAKINPVTYFIQVVRMVVLKGSGFADVKMQFLIISLLAIIINSLAIWNYRKTS